MTIIPFDAALDTEAQISAAVDTLACALAAELSPGPWGPAAIWHDWRPNGRDWSTCHAATLTRDAMRVEVSYMLTEGAGSFNVDVRDSGHDVLSAIHSQGWRIRQGDDAAVEALRRACEATIARLSDV